MPVVSWTQSVNPNYLLIAPELALVATTLIIMIADLYSKQKRNLVYLSLVGVVVSLLFVWFGATDRTIAAAIDGGRSLEFFGNMVVADSFTFFMKAVLLIIAGFTSLLSINFVERFMKGAFTEYFQILFATTLGLMFMVSSRDFLTIYIGLELASISSYVLAGMLRKDPKSNEAGLKYFLNGTIASAVLLFGFSLIYGATGHTNLVQISEALTVALADGTMLPLIVTGVIFMVLGFGFKVAAAPLHLWAPDTYEGAPTPITGFFSAGPKGAAFAAILRIFLVGMGIDVLAGRWTAMWAILAVASMFIGNLTALMQTNIKRMMAYSSVAQAGYVLVGVTAAGSMISGRGTSAVLYYVLAYAITNLGIFAVLTHMDEEGGWVNVSDFKGLFNRSPLYAVAMLFFFVSLIGIPPTVGFMGKFFLFNAALEANYMWLAVIMAINSAISVGYYYGVVKAMFLEPTDKGALSTNTGAQITVAVCAVAVVVVTLLSGHVLSLTDAAAALIR